MVFTRRVDDLGRIVIPKEMRKSLGITEGTECNINLVGNKITITNAENICAICGRLADFEIADNRYICKKCAKEIVKGVENHD